MFHQIVDKAKKLFYSNLASFYIIKDDKLHTLDFCFFSSNTERKSNVPEKEVSSFPSLFKSNSVLKAILLAIRQTVFKALPVFE